jgi:hypothetical protein
MHDPMKKIEPRSHEDTKRRLVIERHLTRNLFVASWLRGFVASWLRGFVASWLRG